MAMKVRIGHKIKISSWDKTIVFRHQVSIHKEVAPSNSSLVGFFYLLRRKRHCTRLFVGMQERSLRPKPQIKQTKGMRRLFFDISGRYVAKTYIPQCSGPFFTSLFVGMQEGFLRPNPQMKQTKSMRRLLFDISGWYLIETYHSGPC